MTGFVSRLFKKIIEKFRCWPIQEKMFYSYAIPTILVFVTASAVAFPIISANYKRELKSTISQTNDQAQNFITNYAQNMDYISQLITWNGDIKATLSSGRFGDYENGSDSYREFYTLNKEFESIELSNDVYRIGIYLPDRCLYANNNYYFYPESELKNRSDYPVLMQSIQSNRYYFAAIDERKSYNPQMTDRYLALFRPLCVTDQAGVEHMYVVKVETLLDNLKQVLYNAGNATDSNIYLTDSSNNLICAKNDQAYNQLKKTGSLPEWKVQDWTEIAIGGNNYFVISRQIEHYRWQIFSLMPSNEFFRRTKFIWTLVVVLLLCLSAAATAVSYRLSRYFTRRLSVISQKMKGLEKGDLNDHFVLKKNSGDEIDKIYANFNYMTEQLHQLMKDRFKLGKDAASANLKALQAQINPHFLYNTLDLINWGAIDHGADQVAEIARNLGQFYRLSLNHGKMAIQIENELQHVEAYVNIENVHFGGAINLTIEVSKEIRRLACLNIILQPFVENSIVHGIAKHPDILECNIEITAQRNGKDLIFAIRDDGPGMNQGKLDGILQDGSSSTYNGYGVKNILSRIQLCYGKEYGVSYQSIPMEGTTAYIHIPALSLEELNDLLK